MGAIAKLLSYPDKIFSLFFLRILPELLHLAILAACIFWKYYQILAKKRNYTAAINSGSSRFKYRKKLRPDSGECSVCLSDYAEGEECCRVVACGHAFHRRCLERWLKGYAPTCPMCRAAVVPEEVAAEYRRLQMEEEDDWIEKEFALILLNALDGGRSCNGFF
ncbi:hypothetical protein C2S53_015799 [Perilla frutescens var. hirtella]|uniref:RING-type domain-containing protein n=1 Tax=Perilla frutescens var. hirtella TaxID=608512 RepID=A0AAD4P6S7_PERFH|nr:hypothetical protein C2S53_015799 [Perilla frutescens var. hirtella]